MNNQEDCKEVINAGNIFKIEVAKGQDPKEIARKLENDFDLVIISPHKCGTTVDEHKECGTAEIMAVKKTEGGKLWRNADMECVSKILEAIHPQDAPVRGRLQEMSEGIEIHHRRCSADQ